MESNNENALKVSVMPNPSSSYFTFEFSGGSGDPILVTIMDAAGRVLEARQQAPHNSTIQVGKQLHAGIYLVEILQGSQKETLKLVKQ